jgi:hypothetical protein
MRMKKVLLAVSLVAFGSGATMALAPPGAHAANADNPYGNVDHRNDAGNDTGDSRVDGLNANQLNENYKGSVQPRAPAGAGMAVPGQPVPMPTVPGPTVPGPTIPGSTVPGPTMPPPATTVR